MNSRQNANLSSKRSDLVDASAVNTLTVVEPLSYDSLLSLVHYFADDVRQVLILLRELFKDSVLDRNESCISYGLVICIKSILELVAELFSDFVHHIVVKFHRLELELRLADLLLDIRNKSDHVLDLCMTELDSLKHQIIRDLVSACLDHNYLLSRTCNGEVEVIVSPLLECRVENELTVNIADVDRSNRSVPRNIRDRDSDRCCDHACDLR